MSLQLHRHIYVLDRNNNTNFDWHSCTVQPKREEAFLPFQRLVTNSKLIEKKTQWVSGEDHQQCIIAAGAFSCFCMKTYFTFGQTERVTKVQSAIHVRVGEGNKVLVFAGRKKGKNLKFLQLMLEDCQTRYPFRSAVVPKCKSQNCIPIIKPSFLLFIYLFVISRSGQFPRLSEKNISTFLLVKDKLINSLCAFPDCCGCIMFKCLLLLPFLLDLDFNLSQEVQLCSSLSLLEYNEVQDYNVNLTLDQ